MRSALLRLLLAAAIVLAGARAYRSLAAPDPDAIGRLAQDELAAIFGPTARTRDFRVDLVEGVSVVGLEVARLTTPESDPAHAAEEPSALSARRVLVHHALLDLVCGLYRPTALDVEGARLDMRETASGLVLEFPFTLSGRNGGAQAPEIRVVDAEITIHARLGSTRLSEGSALRITRLEGAALRGTDGSLSIRGSFHTRGLGQDDVAITFGGSADARSDALDVLVIWDPLRLTPELLGTLAPDLAEALADLPVETGRVEAHVVRTGGEGQAGELTVTPRWIGEMTSDVGDLPGLKGLAPEDKARLRDLLGGGALDVSVERGRLVLRSLTARLGEAQVTARGWLAPDGEELEVEATVTGLSLEDPALRRALGEAGEDIRQQLSARGQLDATVRIAKPRGGTLTWSAEVDLRDGEFTFVGGRTASGERTGFPYRMEHAQGHVHVGPEGLRVDGIEGRHGERTVLRILPSTRVSWQGEETGYVRFGPDGPTLRLTIEALDLPTDADLEAAVAGSEFAGLLDTYRIQGLIDRVEIDLVRRPGIDTVVHSEVRVTLDGERFAWARFPVPLEDVRGVVTLRRPVLAADDPVAVASGSRVGRTFFVDVRASVRQPGGAAPVAVHAEVAAHAARGRLSVKGTGLDLAGPLGTAVREAPLTKDGLGEFWRWLAPRGRADLEGEFPLEDDPLPLRILGRLENVDVTLDAEQSEPTLAVEHIRGVIQAVGDDVRTHGLTGELLGAPLTLEGHWPKGGDGPFDVDLKTLAPVPFTSGFLDAIQNLSACTTLFPYGLTLEPGGQAALDLTIRQLEGASCPDLPRLKLSDVDLALRWPQGPLIRLAGEALIFEEGEVSAAALTISLPGLVAQVADARHGPGGLRGRFDLRLTDFHPGEELLEILPSATRDLLVEWTADRRLTSERLALVLERDESVRLEGDLTFLARPGAASGGAPRGKVRLEAIELSGPDAGDQRTLTGAAVFDGLALEQGVQLAELRGRLEVTRVRLGGQASATARLVDLAGRVEGVRFEGLRATLLWDEGLLVAEPITGTISGGALAATLKVHTRAPEAYEGRIQVRDFDVGLLKDDLAPTGPPYAGRGALELRFQNRTAELADLTAAGRLTVREGRLGELPPVANLFLALAEVLPGNSQPNFETLVADFTLKDEVVRFQRLDLAGPLAKMPGRGRLTLSGQLDITFTPDFIKSMLLPALMPLPVIGDVLEAVLREDLLYAVRVHGDLGSPRTDVVPFPPLNPQRTSTYEAPAPPPPPRRPLPGSFR